MSHKSTTSLELFDKDALRDALTELGVVFQEDATWVAYDRAQSTPCDLMVPHKGNERMMGQHMWSGGVGFSNEAGHLVLVMDDLDKTRPQVAEFLTRFKRAYTEKAAANLLASYGYRITKQADGTYRASATTKTVAMLSKQQAGAKQVQQVGRY